MELKNLILSRGTIYDLIFQGRNKDYGAYQNRRVYPEHIKKSLLILILLFATLYFSFWIYSTYFVGRQVFIPQTEPKPHILIDIQLPPEKIKTVVPPPPPLKVESTIVNTVPKIVENVTKPDKIETTKDIIDSDKKIGGETINTNNPPSQTIEFDKSPSIPSVSGNNGITEPKFVDFAEVMPEFPGGEEALMSYLTSMIRYPNFARDNEIEGTANIEFVVMSDGTIGHIKLLSGFDRGCNEEALRVIKKMPKWIPGKQGGQPVNVIYTIPITFKLSNE